jgi:Tannase and feruloyl esterase
MKIPRAPFLSPIAVVALIVACLVGARVEGAAPTPCASLTQLKIPDAAVSITQAEIVPSGPPPAPPFGPPYEGTLPAYCRASGVIDERIGRNGRPYAIGYSIALPTQWNGRFLFQGGGGFNGTVGPPIGSGAVGRELALARGFAVVSTDSGHTGAVFDGTFFEDQEATVNFLYRAIDKVTVVAKKIIAIHYGRAPEHSYFVGCSTGGREGMLMSQRFPHYFDGIVAGAPAMRTSYSSIGDRWVAVALNSIAPRDESGRPIAARAFSEGEKLLVAQSLLESCDAKDGATDGMIFNVAACGFDPGKLVCKGPKTDACLSREQAAAIKKGFAGPKDSRGIQVYPGFWYDTGITATRGIPGLLSGPFPGFPIDYSTTMDVDREAALAATPVAGLGDSSAWTQLNSFSASGGKLIFYHGVSDPWFSAQDTVQYYDRMTADNGGRDAVMKWSRLFLVPGMSHCSGGDAALDRFDLLDALVNWVEKGTAPDAVVATGNAFPGRSRPLCPYPKHAHYRGTGDMEKAESFECGE